MRTLQTAAAARPRSLVLCAIALGWAGVVPAQYEPDANTTALWHFDTQTAEGTTPDAGPGGFDGVLAGSILPVQEAALLPGYGFGYKFDGVDRGAGNSRIDMGEDNALALRGNGDFTFDVVVTVTAPLADDGYYRGIVCRASSEGVGYSLSYLSWTRPQEGTGEHQFWFATGPGPESTTEYAYAATAFAGHMQVGASYEIRVTVAAGVMNMTVNGVEGTSAYWPAQPGVISPDAVAFDAPLRVGDACPKDYVVKPSELHIDELRLSNVARTDLPILGELQALLSGLAGAAPLDLTFADAQAARAYRMEQLRLAEAAAAPVPLLVRPVLPTSGLTRLRK